MRALDLYFLHIGRDDFLSNDLFPLRFSSVNGLSHQLGTTPEPFRRVNMEQQRSSPMLVASPGAESEDQGNHYATYCPPSNSTQCYPGLSNSASPWPSSALGGLNLHVSSAAYPSAPLLAPLAAPASFRTSFKPAMHTTTLPDALGAQTASSAYEPYPSISVAAAWSALTMPASAFVATFGSSVSPDQSNSSCTSTLSTGTSSPYASDSEGPARSPRRVKGQEPLHYRHDFHYAFQSNPIVVVNPGDLHTYPADVEDDRSDASFVLSKVDDGTEWSANPPCDEEDDEVSMQNDGSTKIGRAPQKRRSMLAAAYAACRCPQCGNLFQRKHNLKVHMETHNVNRKYAFACEEAECSKRFARKTDLVRHVNSVHHRRRDHECSVCGECFARRDTLQRHERDGCGKRAERPTKWDVRTTGDQADKPRTGRDRIPKVAV